VIGDEVRVTDLAADARACRRELAGQDDHVLAVVGTGSPSRSTIIA
jgi:hypothetical protein